MKDLSPSEREVLVLIARGATTTQISRRRDTTPTTTRNLLKRVLDKLGAHTRAHAVAIAYHTGIFVTGKEETT